jgi:hypothetical protein
VKCVNQSARRSSNDALGCVPSRSEAHLEPIGKILYDLRLSEVKGKMKPVAGSLEQALAHWTPYHEFLLRGAGDVIETVRNRS